MKKLTLIAVIVLVFAGEAQSTPIEYDIFVSCSGGGQLCDELFSVDVETGGLFQVQYFVPEAGTPEEHCSSIRLHIFVDNALADVSEWLGWPGATGEFASLPLHTGVLDLGPVDPGIHLLGIQAEGQIGGCNTGSLNSWAGHLEIETSPAPVPEPSTMLLMASGLIGLWGFRKKFKKR